MSPEALEILLSLGGALAAGFLVGAEREQGGHQSFGGVRTFPLIALSGALGMLLGWAALAVMGLLVGVLLATAYYRESARPDGIGMSTEIAAVVTFGLGALCSADELGLPIRDRLLLVAAGATATLALLTVKRPLHHVIGKITEEEIYAVTRLLILAVIVLPLLPDEAMGPWDALNPRSIGILAVLISAIGLVGYAAIRVFGAHRGLGLTGLLGGLVSSTAVTLAFADRARKQGAILLACVVAIVLASATLFPRVLIEVAAVSPELARRAAAPFLAAGVVSFLAGALFYRRLTRGRDGATTPAEVEVGNPFSVWSALKFAGLFVAILLISHGASYYFADVGVYVSSAIAGLADVDAISLSIARMHEQRGISRDTALNSLAIVATSNTLSKIVLCAVLGSAGLALRVALCLLAGLAAAGVTIAIVEAL